MQTPPKPFLDKGVEDYLGCLTAEAQTIMLCYGGGSIKRNGVYAEITALLRSEGKKVVEYAACPPAIQRLLKRLASHERSL